MHYALHTYNIAYGLLQYCNKIRGGGEINDQDALLSYSTYNFVLHMVVNYLPISNSYSVILLGHFDLPWPVVPPPAVAVFGAQISYAGTLFTLTCTIQVNENVHTPIDVTGEWSKGGVTLAVDSSGCMNISEAISTVDMFTYETSLTFTPLRSSVDAGEYTCNATVSSVPQTYIRPNSNTNTFHLVINGMILISNILMVYYSVLLSHHRSPHLMCVFATHFRPAFSHNEVC